MNSIEMIKLIDVERLAFLPDKVLSDSIASDRFGYLGIALHQPTRQQVIQACVKRLWRKQTEFDAIAFRGLSGALIAPSVADQLGKKLIAIRKPDDGSHGTSVEGETSETQYIILDDFVSSGSTVRAIIDAITSNARAKNSFPLAVLTYRKGWHEDGIRCKINGMPDVTLWSADWTETS